MRWTNVIQTIWTRSAATQAKLTRSHPTPAKSKSTRAPMTRLEPKSARSGHSLKWLVVLAVALLAAGCTGWAGGPSDADRRGAISGRATAQIGGYTFPLSGAQLVVAGSYSGIAQTNRSGHYSYTRLGEGNKKVTLQALHGSYEKSVYVSSDERQPQTLDWHVQPKSLDAELFFHLSGLKRLYVDDRGRFIADYGTLVRWEKPIVWVHFDVPGAPYGFSSSWVDSYSLELRRWETYLNNRHTFVRTNDPKAADIVVSWVPKGYLGDHAGIARHVAFFANGALKRVEIEIDVAYGDFPGLWEHELAHAMGVDHVSDSASVLYPFLNQYQRTTLSATELAHVRLMYDIPSGQQLSWSRGYGSFGMIDGAADGTGFDDVRHDDADDFDSNFGSDFGAGADSEAIAADPDSAFAVEAAPVTGRREHVLYLDDSLWR